MQRRVVLQYLVICLCKIQKRNYYHPQMKFAKVMFYLSVILFTGGCLGPGQGGCPSPGMAVSACGIQAQAHWGVRQGVSRPRPRGCVSQHALRQTALQQTATAADDMHPTGMHSSYYYYNKCLKEIT